ncbi:hypothetical protein AAFF_G00399710 [Aldrovandia affinis]|uniref:Uncharacterized protein n=1 Tax=Aldrovandia affinis TaxID=143900 RepID=A0AAD7SCX0_9TELE|nr:hypothetical protein AAFF_G00399710 [Aldrovandia affinis]
MSATPCCGIRNQAVSETKAPWLLFADKAVLNLKWQIDTTALLPWLRGEAEDAAWRMGSDGEQHDTLCQKAVTLIVDLCLGDSPLLTADTCQEFLLLLTSRSSSLAYSGNFSEPRP